jgi:uncharacterized protein YceK
MKKAVLLIIAAILLGGCSSLNKPKIAHNSFSSYDLKNIVLKAISGDTIANKQLTNLVDLKLPINNDYNTIVIDSLVTKAYKKYLTVLINYPNPIYNRFAIYDTLLNVYLIDKSLNGYINEAVINLNDKKLVTISESFISKDILQVSRISVYQLNDSSANLSLRTFTKLVDPKITFNQKIIEFSSDSIKTELSSSKISPLSGKTDLFTFEQRKKKYISKDTLFDNFVLNRINNFKSYSDKPEISDKKSLYASVGIDVDIDTIKNTGNIKNEQGYTLTLTDNWKTLKNISITDFLKTAFKGTKYINELIGAHISVVALPAGDSSENFIAYKLTNSAAGKYKVRYSEKVVSKKDYVQFFEYSCGTKKYLLILTVSKYTYEKFKTDYDNIINSFSINC